MRGRKNQELRRESGAATQKSQRVTVVANLEEFEGIFSTPQRPQRANRVNGGNHASADRPSGHVTWAATPNPFFHLARTAETNNGSIMRPASRCQSGRRWDAFVVDDASVPVFLRIANLFKRPALIRIQEAKREEEGRQEGGIHPRPGLASFVVLGAAAGSRES